mmetsp:Transcript_39566/g.88942  ORF Transcript_39566/g.88942 Transcript_39566/m.88942 type:complete len:232 (+) Transcript_39566:228-923(+)
MTLTEDISGLMPILSIAVLYFGNAFFTSAKCVLWLCFHLDPQEASAKRTAMASSADIFCKNSVFNVKLSTAMRTVSFRAFAVIFALPWTSVKFSSLIILPSSNTFTNSSPGAPLVNSWYDIGKALVISPSAVYSPRFRRTPSEPRMTGGLPPYDFLPPAIGSFPTGKTLPSTYMAQHLNAQANESRFSFCSNPPPEPKCTVLAQNPLASRLDNISPTVSKATPSPCKMRIC